jgi:hypothetical protein
VLVRLAREGMGGPAPVMTTPSAQITSPGSTASRHRQPPSLAVGLQSDHFGLGHPSPEVCQAAAGQGQGPALGRDRDPFGPAPTTANVAMC